MICFFFFSLERTSSNSAISFSSASISSMRFKIYSRFKWRSLISATYSACVSSMPKPIIKFGTTSDSFSVSRTILIALSISSSILERPFKRCSCFLFLARLKFTRLVIQFSLNRIHSFKSSLTPRTPGLPSIRTLKLQENVSSSGVSLYSRCISLSGSVPLFRSIVIFRPFRSVSSRISDISFTLLAFANSTILSMTASEVVVGGISVISIQL